MQLRQWHKRAGLFAFIFMGWLGISGFLINQSADWGYDTTRVNWSWLMSLYGLRPEPPRSGFYAGDHWLASTPEHTLLDGEPLPDTLEHLVGMAMNGDEAAPMLFVAAPDKLLLYGETDRQRIDELSGFLLPIETIRRIGHVPSSGAVVVQDLDAYSTLDGLEWTKLSEGARVEWSNASSLTDEQRQAAVPYARPSVSLEHILVDAHSGRLFGRFGAYVINAVGIAAVLLSVTGVWMMWRTSRRRREPPKKR